jgi:tRNA (guanine-N7-)-methyltransferase
VSRSPPPRPYADAPRLPEGEIDPRELVLSHGAPVELEIGPGRGAFILDRLEQDRNACVIGLEIRRKWASLVDERIRRLGFGARGRVFAEDAKVTLPRFRPATLSVMYLHFPDPWWKKRHQKRLVLGQALLDGAARALVQGGELFVQTDVAERADAYEALVARDARFAPCGATVRIDDNPYGARSARERRALADGLPVYKLRWRRV